MNSLIEVTIVKLKLIGETHANIELVWWGFAGISSSFIFILKSIDRYI